MTCIIGYLDSKNNTMYMAGDTAITDINTGLQTQIQGSKISIKNGNMLFGSSGSLELLNILKFDFKPPKQLVSEEIDHYIHVTVKNSLKATFEVNLAPDEAGTILCMYKGRLFKYIVCNNMDVSVEENRDHFLAIGIYEYAMAILSMKKYIDPSMTIEELLVKALEITSNQNNRVNRKFTLQTLRY